MTTSQQQPLEWMSLGRFVMKKQSRNCAKFMNRLK